MDAQSSLQRQNRVRRLGHLTARNMPHANAQKQPSRWFPHTEAHLHIVLGITEID